MSQGPDIRTNADIIAIAIIIQAILIVGTDASTSARNVTLIMTAGIGRMSPMTVNFPRTCSLEFNPGMKVNYEGKF